MLEAVVLDWGGTLTPWHAVDFAAEALALALAARDAHPEAHRALQHANQVVWARSKDSQVSATLADVSTEAGLLLDGAVYTSEVPWTKPPEAFRAAARAVGVEDPSRCVLVGDRLFDDVWGAAQVGRSGRGGCTRCGRLTAPDPRPVRVTARAGPATSTASPRA